MKRSPDCTSRAAIWLLLLAVTGTAAAQDPVARSIYGHDLLDLNFGGGSAVEYLDAIREAVGDVNIVVQPDVELVRVQPMELRGVAPSAAIQLLSKLEQTFEDQVIRLDVDFIGSAEQGGLPVYVVSARSNRGSRPRSTMSHVWSLARLIEDGARPDDILMAVHISLELLGDVYDPAQIRFHKETRLLLVRGWSEQIQAMERVIDEMAGALEATRIRREQEASWQDALQQVAALKEQLARAKAESEALAQDQSGWRMRVEMMMRELDAREKELHDIRGEMRAALQEREAEIAVLTRKVQELLPKVGDER